MKQQRNKQHREHSAASAAAGNSDGRKPSAAAVVEEGVFARALAERLTELSLSLPSERLALLTRYYVELVETNRVMNLTGIVEAAEVAEKHIADSLRLLTFLEEAGPDPLAGKILVDVGTGAGLPGIPLAAVCPHCRVVLLDAQRKRCDFLSRVCRELGLSQTEVLWGRAEELARQPARRERADLAVARAVAPLPLLAEYTAGLVKPGGAVIAMKGGNLTEELKTAAHALAELRLRVEKRLDYTLTSGERRSLLLLRKTAPLAEKYPRNSGVIKKKPL